MINDMITTKTLEIQVVISTLNKYASKYLNFLLTASLIITFKLVYAQTWKFKLPIQNRGCECSISIADKMRILWLQTTECGKNVFSRSMATLYSIVSMSVWYPTRVQYAHIFQFVSWACQNCCEFNYSTFRIDG